MVRTRSVAPSGESDAVGAELKSRAGTAFRNGDLRAALDILKRYVCISPEDAAGYTNSLAVARRNGAGVEILTRLAGQALALEPGNPSPLVAVIATCTDRQVPLPDGFTLVPDAFAGHAELAIAAAIYLHRTGRNPEGSRVLRRAILSAPGHPRLYHQLGLLRQNANDSDPAKAFKKALYAAEADSPVAAEAAEHLAANLHAAGDLVRAVELYRTALTRLPGASGLRANLAAALVDCGEAEAAEAELRRTLILEPAHRDGLWLSSCLRIGAGDFSGGYRAHHVRWTEPHDGARTLEFGTLPLWMGQPAEGRRILVWSDFGIGDEIIFAPLAQWLAERGAEIVLDIDPRLVTLCRRSFPDISVVARDGAPRDLASFDYQVPSPLLARFYEESGRTAKLSAFKADPERAAEIREMLGRAAGAARLVGFAWGGGGARTSWSKSTELADWQPLLSGSEIRLVSLQYAGAGGNGDLPETILPSPVRDLRNDLEGLAALISALDATVSISGINAHMAGALRRPGFILLPRLPLWFWGRDGNTSRWYPSLRLFRRTDSGWDAPIADLSQSVRQFLSP